MAKITDEQIKEMMRLRREGKSDSEIALIVGCHRQTVRAYLRERQSNILVNEVKKEVLKEELLRHFKEVADFAGKEEVNRFKYSNPEGKHAVGLLGVPGVGSPLYMANEWERIYEPLVRENPLREALQAHTEYSPLWRCQKEWDGMVKEYKLRGYAFYHWLDRKTEVLQIQLLVKWDDRKKIKKWLFGNALRLASDEPYTGLNIVKSLNHAELRCSYDGTVIAEVESLEDAKALSEHLAGILKEGQELDLLNELQETMKEVKERQDELLETSNKIISELKILGMKRAFPGTCPLCPI